MATARVLNPDVALPGRIRPCEPQVEVFTYPDDVCVAFDANSLCAVALDATMGQQIARKEHGFSGLLFSRIAPDFAQPAAAAPIRKVVLNLTHACNMACRYCFAADYAHQGVMTTDTAMQAAGLIGPNLPPDVAFFGGEPLLAGDRMMEIAEHCKALAAERRTLCRLHVTTNGTLLTPARAAALKRLGFSLLISLDGPEVLHDATRVLKTGGGSFRLVMEALHTLKEAGLSHRVMVRATFTEDRPALVERLEFFARLHRDGLINGVSIEPAILTEGCAGRNPAPDRTDLTDPSEEWHRAAVWYAAHVKETARPLPYFYFRKLAQRILRYEFMGNECGAGRGYVCAGPDGTLYACHREAGTRIGALARPDASGGSGGSGRFDEAARAEWAGNCLAKHPECTRCWARHLCGGGCAQARAALGGGLSAETPALCDAKRAMIREVFWLLAQLTPAEIRRATS